MENENLETGFDEIITEGEDAEARKEKRANVPLQKITEYLTKTDFTSWKKEHKDFIKKLGENPYNTYKELKNRLILNGQMASFPEFKGVIGTLVEALFQNEEIYKYYNSTNDKRAQLEIVMHKLIAILNRSRYFFPYASTIYTMESILILLDAYYRDTSTEDMPNYYHNFRYRTYLDYIVLEANPENIVMPTFTPTGASFFIKIRCVPILILGVATEPTWADQYLNSPLDFWAHDMQHARRQIQETLSYYDRYIKHQTYYDNRDPFNIITEDQFYFKMSKFTKEHILPIIKTTKQDSKQIKGYKNVIKLIIFEVVHEKAWPITALSICRCVPLQYDIFPIETLTISEENGQQHVDAYVDSFNDPTTLSNLRGKIRHGFYDRVDDLQNIIIPEEYRTSEIIAKCAKILLSLLGCDCSPDMKLLLKLTKDQKNASEFSQSTSIQIPDVPSDENFDGEYTDNDLDKLTRCDKLIPSKIKAITDKMETIPLPKNINEYFTRDFSEEDDDDDQRKLKETTLSQLKSDVSREDDNASIQNNNQDGPRIAWGEGGSSKRKRKTKKRKTKTRKTKKNRN